MTIKLESMFMHCFLNMALLVFWYFSHSIIEFSDTISCQIPQQQLLWQVFLHVFLFFPPGNKVENCRTGPEQIVEVNLTFKPTLFIFEKYQDISILVLASVISPDLPVCPAAWLLILDAWL